MLLDLATKIRENMSLRRLQVIDVPAGAVVSSYVHSDGKTGVVVVITADKDVSNSAVVKEFAYDCCLHMAAFTPAYIKREDVDEAYIAEQTEIFTKQVESLDKPENVKAGIVKGKINKHLADICFMDQPFVKDDKVSVAKKMEEIGKAALVAYSNATQKSLNTKWIDNVPVCHIHMLESDCYQIVANPDCQLLQFVEESAIIISSNTNSDIAAESQSAVSSGNKNLIQAPSLFDKEFQNADKPEDKDKKAKLHTEAESVLSTTAMVADPLYGNKSECVKIIIGQDTKCKDIIFEANNTKKISHPNMGIVGGMGFGKTQFALSLIAQFAKEKEHNVDQRPIGMLIFDYKGDDYSTESFLKKVDGKCYSHHFPFNPLKLVITEKTKFMNLPAVTADRISDSFAKAYGLGQVQQSTIKQVILETYQDFGITNDPSTWGKPQPTMNNVVDKYFEQYDAKDKTYALFDKLRDYSIFTTDNSKCVSLFEWLDGVKVIDLTPYPGDTKKVIVSLILDLFYEEMRQMGASKLDGEYRELRAMILVDEAHQFLNKDFNSFRNIISEGRMFGVGMVLSTQNLSDFKSAKQEYSQFILSWVILHLNNITKAEVANIFGSNDPNCQAYVDIVSKAEKFHGICKIGNEVKQIKTLPYYQLIQEDKRFITP